jgi:hypothetical protein
VLGHRPNDRHTEIGTEIGTVDPGREDGDTLGVTGAEFGPPGICLGVRVNYTRRHKRFQLNSLEIGGQMTYASEVSVLDISMGGLSLRADRRLNIGGSYKLKLECGQKAVSVLCQVAWARMSGTKKSADGETVPLYTAGMKFIDLSPEGASELFNFVECLGKDDPAAPEERRADVRFHIDSPGTTRLIFPTDYRVRTISLSGMLIESAEAMERELRVPMVLSLQDDRCIEFVGRVVSCQPTEGLMPVRCQIGIEFIDVSEDARDVLAAFIEMLSASTDA